MSTWESPTTSEDGSENIVAGSKEGKNQDKEIMKCFVAKRGVCEKDELDMCIALGILLGPHNVKGSCYSTDRGEDLKRVCLSVSNRCYICCGKEFRQKSHNNCTSDRERERFRSENLWTPTHSMDLDQFSYEISAVICQ